MLRVPGDLVDSRILFEIRVRMSVRTGYVTYGI
jgi:hypothetical protein